METCTVLHAVTVILMNFPCDVVQKLGQKYLHLQSCAGINICSLFLSVICNVKGSQPFLHHAITSQLIGLDKAWLRNWMGF